MRDPKILFYTGLSRIFRTITIGYLYEFSQIYPVVLLSEKLDSKTEKILADKNIFPKLEKIIPIQQPAGKKTGLFAENKYLYNLAKNTIERYKPDIVAINDNCLFDTYLRRFAKKQGAISIFFLGTFLQNPPEITTWHNLLTAGQKIPAFLPLRIRVLLARLRKFLGHFLYFWILPLSVGQMPFLKEPSFIYSRDISRYKKGADYYIVFSKKDYDMCEKMGFPAKKLIVLNHPLKRDGARKFLKDIYFSSNQKEDKVKDKILTIMWPEAEIGFKRENFSLISKEEMKESRIRIVSLVSQILKDWKIFIKPHPMIKNNPEKLREIVKTLESISNQIKVVDPSESAEEYIEKSSVILGPPPASWTVFTASLSCPEKPILSLDLDQEFSGDFYRGYDNIEYIDNEQSFINILKLIRDNKYNKNKIESKPEGFLNVADLLNNILKR